MGIVAVATLPLGILAAVSLGLFEAFVVFVVGWLFLVPVLAIVLETLGLLEGDDDADDAIEDAVEQRVADSIAGAADGVAPADADGTASPTGSDEDPLETLRERYARGEIDDVEFERKLERLIETEDVEVPPEVSLDRTDDEEASADREPAFET